MLLAYIKLFLIDIFNGLKVSLYSLKVKIFLFLTMSLLLSMAISLRYQRDEGGTCIQNSNYWHADKTVRKIL